MLNDPQDFRLPVTQELDPELAERELVSLQSLLGFPVARERLDSWAMDNKSREALLADTVWGTIRWRKSLGRPGGPDLGSAFEIEHLSWQYKKEFVESGARFIRLTVPHPEPSKWDGPEDDEYYRVGFMAETPQRETRIRVSLAPSVRWDPPVQPLGSAGSRVTVHLRGYQDIVPPAQWFLKGPGRYVLDPFEVVRKPFAISRG